MQKYLILVHHSSLSTIQLKNRREKLININCEAAKEGFFAHSSKSKASNTYVASQVLYKHASSAFFERKDKSL